MRRKATMYMDCPARNVEGGGFDWPLPGPDDNYKGERWSEIGRSHETSLFVLMLSKPGHLLISFLGGLQLIRFDEEYSLARSDFPQKCPDTSQISLIWGFAIFERERQQPHSSGRECVVA